MRRIRWLVGVAVTTALVGGCVERRYVITSDPSGAIVQRNYQPIGATPADDHFLYYGKYHFTLIPTVPGYATLQVDQDVPAPWYEYFPLDFVSENLIPWRIEDVRRFHYQLPPLQPPNLGEVLNRGQGLRDRGQTLGPPAPAPAPAPSP
jgi:hypothetical protein